jgi:Tol biopolymer transport system component
MRPLTDCVKARCTAPAWHPGGTQIAYQRADTNPATGRTEPRVWVVNVVTAQSHLLSPDLQAHGATPVWDPTGQRVAFFDETVPGIRILKLTTGSEVVIENPHGAVGSFSPDGSRLVYPVITRGALGETFYTHLDIVTLDEMTIERISGNADAPVEDVFAGWSPDGSRLLVARRYLDERYTSGTQLYALDVESGQAEPLVVDPAYNHAAMAWDATGRWIVFQRFSLAEAGAQPEIWLYDSAHGESMRVAENAFLPAFVP